jgi:hypothetical protein
VPADPSAVVLGQPFAFDLASTAEEQPGATYALVTGPSWLTMDAGTGVLSGTPNRRAHIDSKPVTVRVSDGQGGTDDHTFQLTVQGQVITLTATLPTPLTKTTFTDASGDLVSVGAKGLGTFYLVRGVAPAGGNNAPGDLVSIEVEGADAKSAIKMKTKAIVKGVTPTTSVHDIVINGSMSLSAPQLDVLGDVTVTGGVGKWDVRSGADGFWAIAGAAGSVSVRGDFTNCTFQAGLLKSFKVKGLISENGSDGDTDFIRVLAGGFSAADVTWKGYVPPEYWFSGVRAYVG